MGFVHVDLHFVDYLAGINISPNDIAHYEIVDD